jgi:hypothetical protein
MKPGSGGGAVQNAKAQAKQKQVYSKTGGKAAAKSPPKKPGMSGDSPGKRKGSPLSKGK